MVKVNGIEITKGCSNDDYIEGYMDGRDPNSPEPSDNRSECYKHSFDIGRREGTGKHLKYDAAIKRAELAKAKDEGR